MDRINQSIVDAVEMAGDINIYVGIVGRTLYKNLYEEISKIIEPASLVVSFENINHVDDSALLISIVRALAQCRKNKWRKNIVCTNVNDLHRKMLQNAIISWSDISDLWGDKPDERKRLLLLITSKEYPKRWNLLGELNDIEKRIWDNVQDEGYIPLSELAERTELNNHRLKDCLSIFLENRVLFLDKKVNSMMVCKLSGLLNAGS